MTECDRCSRFVPSWSLCITQQAYTHSRVCVRVCVAQVFLALCMLWYVVLEIWSVGTEWPQLTDVRQRQRVRMHAHADEPAFCASQAEGNLLMRVPTYKLRLWSVDIKLCGKKKCCCCCGKRGTSSSARKRPTKYRRNKKRSTFGSHGVAATCLWQVVVPPHGTNHGAHVCMVQL